MKNKQLGRYLLWAFLLAWMLQAAVIGFAWNGQVSISRMILAASMFAPLLAAVLAKIPLQGMGWHLRLRGKGKWVLAAWFGPALLSALGAALFFLCFPAAFDKSGELLRLQLGEAGIAQLKERGLTLQTLLLVQFGQMLTYAPFLNALFAVGEEAGWRGAMVPLLKERFGVAKGRLIGGAIWGMWHWPIIILIGYNYGAEYWGAPVLGPLLFCVICVALGVLLDFLYEKTDCIWIPALAHGAFNGVASAGVLLMKPAFSDLSTLGPTPIGLLSGLPLLVFGFLLLGKSGRAAPAAPTE